MFCYCCEKFFNEFCEKFYADEVLKQKLFSTYQFNHSFCFSCYKSGLVHLYELETILSPVDNKVNFVSNVKNFFYLYDFLMLTLKFLTHKEQFKIRMCMAENIMKYVNTHKYLMKDKNKFLKMTIKKATELAMDPRVDTIFINTMTETIKALKV